MIEDSLRYLHRNFGVEQSSTLSPPIGQNCTYIYINNSKRQHHRNACRGNLIKYCSQCGPSLPPLLMNGAKMCCPVPLNHCLQLYFFTYVIMFLVLLLHFLKCCHISAFCTYLPTVIMLRHYKLSNVPDLAMKLLIIRLSDYF